MPQGRTPLNPGPWPLAPLPGLYVHIPFCQSKCPYCDFYSLTDLDLIPAYLTALDQEASLYQEQFPAFDSLFLGGGTPSLLSGVQLDRLMTTLRRHFHLAPDAEITLEANPDDITRDKLARFLDLGINRLSLGVQSCHEAELRFLGRRHTARQTLAALELIRAAGFANLGLDLMYGLPGQRQEDWVGTLETALQFAPEHLSCYQLTISSGTPLGQLAAGGRLAPLDEEAERAFFFLTSQFLTERGYLHYEIANFAREEAYRCRHNHKYWRHIPYLGLGPGAHSFQGIRRWWNFSSVGWYVSGLRDGAAPVAGSELLTPEQLRLEALFLGFRTREGVALADLKPHPHWQAILQELQQAGLVRVQDGRAVATLEGLAVADRLPLSFAA